MKPCVLSVASEVFPLVKTGGLADVIGALPAALAPEGVAVRTLVPGYPAVLQALRKSEAVASLPDLFGAEARVLAGDAAGLAVLALDAPHLYNRPGGLYAGPDGQDWADNALRFAALGQVAARIGRGLIPGFLPDIVHAHDWQGGLAPAYLHYGDGVRPATVMTVHNIAFQGKFPADLLPILGLPPSAWHIDGVEYYGTIGYLKAGLQLADRITTVSPSYATEIRSKAGGMGLGGLFVARSNVLEGILNGIDENVWNPASDPHLTARFDRRRMAARQANKTSLQARLGLAAEPKTLLFGAVGRLTWQKGVDLLLEALPALLRQGAQLAILGSGERLLEAELVAASAGHSGRIGVALGYDEGLAHLIQGGSDALLVPSRFEPCGLTQLCALRYGALPVVARVGGLIDTIIDANEMALAAGVATGIQFAPPAADMLAAAIDRTAALWRDHTLWRRLQRNAMNAEVGWSRPAHHYAELYRSLLAARTAHARPAQS